MRSNTQGVACRFAHSYIHHILRKDSIRSCLKTWKIAPKHLKLDVYHNLTSERNLYEKKEENFSLIY